MIYLLHDLNLCVGYGRLSKVFTHNVDMYLIIKPVIVIEKKISQNESADELSLSFKRDYRI